jgi:ATP-dependent Lhr-like helicase
VQLEGMPLSYAELNRSILPARVRDYSPRMLDELGAIGFVVWVGCGALGARDGKVALFRRERVAKLLDPPELGEEATPLARALHTELGLRGACFFADLLAAVEANAELAEAGASPRREAIAEALWDLVWAGLVTNDTFQPLRALSMRGSSRSGGRRGTDLKTAGRWSLVAPLIGAGTSPTERAHARALMLLERHAIVSRDAVSLEAFPGGFSGVYPILRGMEDAGKLRRGYFVEGIGGAQFALAGAVDRLRGMRAPTSQPLVTVLSASDPANPYGWILPWPDTAATTTRQPKRATGALVVLVDGEATLYLERGGRTLLCFAGVDREALIRALEGLRQRLARYSHKSLRIDEIDGQPALSSPWAAAIKEHGIEFDHKGFVIEREV